MAVLGVSPQKASERLKSLSETPMYVKMLIYGDPGVGKTYAACTAPKPLLILSEWAIARLTLERLRIDKGIDPDTIYVNSWDDFLKAYAYAAANVSKYSTVVVDGLTDLNDRVIEEILKESVMSAASAGRRVAHDPDQLEIGDWGKVSNRTLYAMRLFRDLPCHVVMTALAQEVRNEMFTAPLLQPKGALKRAAAHFNTVCYLVTEQKPGKPSTRKLYTDITHSFLAKNPGGALPAAVDDPDLGVLIPQIMNSLSIKDNDANKKLA
jgi:hypothetical protein